VEEALAEEFPKEAWEGKGDEVNKRNSSISRKHVKYLKKPPVF
jgi:hypothetical protein